METLPTETVGVLLFEHIFRLAGDAAPALSKVAASHAVFAPKPVTNLCLVCLPYFKMFKFHKEPGFDLKNLGASKGLKEHSVGVVDTVTTAVKMLNGKNLHCYKPVTFV